MMSMMIVMMFGSDGDEREIIGRSFSKVELEEIVRAFIEEHLEHTDSGVLYLFLKQLEYAVKVGIEALKEGAFDSIGYRLAGEASGTVNGHAVVISYPHEWQYSPAVDELKEKQKQELSELQEQEKREGAAKQVAGKGRITIALRDE